MAEAIPIEDRKQGLGVSGFLCMECSHDAVDAYEYTENVDAYGGPNWVYCRKCDCWTEHPEKP
jgi:hypothetical protein